MADTANLTVPGTVAAISTGRIFRSRSVRAPQYESTGRDSDPKVVRTRATECSQFLASVHDVGAYSAPVTSYSHPSQVMCEATDAEIAAVIDGMGW